MLKYTAILITNPDGSHTARAPVVPGCEAQGNTRNEALQNISKAVTARLADIVKSGGKPPREERSPARTVHVLDPRHGWTIPYVVILERMLDGNYQTTPVLFPDVQETAASGEEALALIGPRLYQHLVNLMAQGKGFPTQDDPHSYVIQVPEPPAA